MNQTEEQLSRELSALLAQVDRHQRRATRMPSLMRRVHRVRTALLRIELEKQTRPTMTTETDDDDTRARGRWWDR